MFMRGTYKITEILKKTKAKGLEDIQVGDVIVFEVILAKRGIDRNFNWLRPTVNVTNLSTGITTEKEFSTVVKLLDSFKWENYN